MIGETAASKVSPPGLDVRAALAGHLVPVTFRDLERSGCRRVRLLKADTLEGSVKALIERALATEDAEIQRLRDETTRLRDEVERLGRELEANRKAAVQAAAAAAPDDPPGPDPRVLEAETRAAVAVAEAERLVAERDGARRERAAAEADRDVARTAAAAIAAERDALRAERDAVAADRDGLASARELARGEHAALEAARAELAQDVEDLEALVHDRDALLEQRHALESERDRLASDLARTEGERARLAAEVERLTAECARIDGRKAEAEAARARAEADLAQARVRLAETLIERERLRTELGDEGTRVMATPGPADPPTPITPKVSEMCSLPAGSTSNPAQVSENGSLPGGAGRRDPAKTTKRVAFFGFAPAGPNDTTVTAPATWRRAGEGARGAPAGAPGE